MEATDTANPLAWQINVLTRNLLGQAELLETAVDYIQHLQKQVEELRELGHGGHATPDVDVQRCAGCQNQNRGSMSII